MGAIAYFYLVIMCIAKLINRFAFHVATIGFFEEDGYLSAKQMVRVVDYYLENDP